MPIVDLMVPVKTRCADATPAQPLRCRKERVEQWSSRRKLIAALCLLSSSTVLLLYSLAPVRGLGALTQPRSLVVCLLFSVFFLLY
jgi:hypothetical protein